MSSTKGGDSTVNLPKSGSTRTGGAEPESNWPSMGNAKEGQLYLGVVSRNEGNGPMPVGEARQERTASAEKTTGCATPFFRTHPSGDKYPGSGCPCYQF